MLNKKYKDLKFTDDFMFGRILRSDKNICIGILELLLDIKIRDIRYAEDQKTIDVFFNSKGIRLDVYVEDEEGTIYDIEMQTTASRCIAKRSRYYQSAIDTRNIEKGALYEDLKKSYVIFICLHDPFGRGLPVYTFENRCNQDGSIALNDEAYKVFVNAEGNKDGISDDMAAFLNYLKYSNNPDSKLTGDIDSAVKRVIAEKDWEGDFVTLEIYLRDHSEELLSEARAEARAEAWEEGIAEGRAKGIAEGRARGIAEGRAKGIAEGNVKGKRAEKKTIALKLNSMGMSDVAISDAVDAPLDDVRNWILESFH